MEPGFEQLQKIDAEAKKAGKEPVYPMFTINKKTEEKISLKQLLTQMGSRRGSYAPRIRVGDYVVEGKKSDGSWYREHASNQISAGLLKTKLENQGYVIDDITKVKKLGEEVYQSVNPEAIGKFVERAMEGVDVTDEVKSAVYRPLMEALSDEMKLRGYRGAMIARNEGPVVEGYITDATERFTRYMTGVAAGLAKARAAMDMYTAVMGEYGADGKREGGIDPIKEPRAHKFALTYMKNQLRNADSTDRKVSILKTIIAAKYLSSPKTWVVNLTGMGTSVPPALHQYAMGGKGSMVKVLREINKSINDLYIAAKSGKPLKGDEARFMQDVFVKGETDAKFTEENAAILEGQLGKFTQKGMNALMYGQGVSERMNRSVTLLAGYRLARGTGQNHEEATATAIDANDKANGVYGKQTEHIFAQSDVAALRVAGTLLSQFQKFPHNYLQLIAALIGKKNYKAALYASLSGVVVGGVSAFPFKTAILASLVFALKELGDDEDPEKKVISWLREEFGDTAETLYRSGVTGLAGVDISGSLGMGVSAPEEWTDLLGPAGGLINDLTEAKDRINAGNPWSAVGAVLLPRMFGAPLKAYDETERGALTKKNRRVWNESGESYAPDGWETLTAALGFRSSERAKLAGRDWESKKTVAAFKKRREDIYLLVRVRGDVTPDLMKRIDAFNDAAEKMQDKHGLTIPFITDKTVENQLNSLEVPGKRALERIGG
jgi:hypothetical protein